MNRPMMSLLAVALLSVATCAAAQTGDGRSAVTASSDGRYDDRVPDGATSYYDQARVIRVDPLFDEGWTGRDRRCRQVTSGRRIVGDDGYADAYDGYGAPVRGGYGDYDGDGYGAGVGRDRRDRAGSTLATIAGGVVGAVLGSHIGGGSGRIAATAVGSMVGGMAGRELYEQSRQNRDQSRLGTVTVCDPEPVRDGYGYRRDRGDGVVRAYDVTYEYNGRRYTRRMDYHPGDWIRVRVEVIPQ